MGFLEDLFGRLSPQRPPVDVFGGVEPLDAFGDLMGDGSDALPPITPFGGLDRSFGGFGGGLGSTTSSSPAFWQMPALGGGIGTNRQGAFSSRPTYLKETPALPSRRAFSTQPAAQPTGTTPTSSGAPAGTRDTVLRWLPLVQKYSQKYGVPAELILASIDSESGGDPKAVGPDTGGQGRAYGLLQGMQMYWGKNGDLTDPDYNLDTIVGQLMKPAWDKYQSAAHVRAVTYGGPNAIDSAGNIKGQLSDAGIPGWTISKDVAKYLPKVEAYKRYLQGQQQPAAGEGALAGTGGLTPDQFNMGLSTADAMSACGPAAAIAFARSTGRNPTPQEAIVLARQVGWNPQQGMAGPQSQVALLKQMGIAATMTQGVDWERVKTEAAAGRPVIIDSPAHYFVVEGYDPATNRFNFGNSAARALRKAGGNAWWRPEDLGNLIDGGTPRSAIYLGTA